MNALYSNLILERVRYALAAAKVAADLENRLENARPLALSEPKEQEARSSGVQELQNEEVK